MGESLPHLLLLLLSPPSAPSPHEQKKNMFHLQFKSKLFFFFLANWQQRSTKPRLVYHQKYKTEPLVCQRHRNNAECLNKVAQRVGVTGGVSPRAPPRYRTLSWTKSAAASTTGEDDGREGGAAAAKEESRLLGQNWDGCIFGPTVTGDVASEGNSYCSHWLQNASLCRSIQLSWAINQVTINLTSQHSLTGRVGAIP